MSRKLLRPAALTPGVSLRGLVLDACADNRLPHSFLLLQHFGMVHRNRVFVSESSSLDTAGLAAALRVEEDDIRMRQYPSVGRTNRSFFGLILSKTQIESRVRRFSPTAINNGVLYHPATHELRDLPFSTVGWDILQSHCGCVENGTIQKWIKANGTSRCDACGASLGKVPAIPIPKEWRKPLSLIANLVDPDPDAQRRATTYLPSVLQAADRTLLFNTIKNLARATTKKEDRADPLSWANALANSCDNILSWTGSLEKAVRSPDCSDQLWWWVRRFYPILDTCRTLSSSSDKTPALGVPQYSPSGTLGKVEFDLVSLSAASKLTGIDATALKKTWDAGKITPHRMVFAGKSVRAFDQAELLKITRHLRITFARSETARRLGLPVYGVEQLAANGLIEPAAPDASTNQSAAYSVATEHFVQLLIDKQSPEIEEPTPLYDAIRLVSGRKKPWGAAFKKLVCGNIPYTFTPRDFESNVCRGIEIPTKFVSTIYVLNSKIDEEADVIPSEHWSQIDALEVLNANRGDASPLRGLAYTGKNPKLYRAQDVLDRAKRGVTTSDLSRRAGISVKETWSILDRANVATVAPGLWDRRAAETEFNIPSYGG